MSTQVAEFLEQALAAFGPNGENWINHAPGEDEGTHCMLSAIPIGFFAQHFHDCEKFLACAIGEDKGGGNNTFIARWNDTEGRTWPEVKAAYEKAIATARRGTE